MERCILTEKLQRILDEFMERFEKRFMDKDPKITALVMEAKRVEKQIEELRTYLERKQEHK